MGGEGGFKGYEKQVVPFTTVPPPPTTAYYLPARIPPPCPAAAFFTQTQPEDKGPDSSGIAEHGSMP